MDLIEQASSLDDGTRTIKFLFPSISVGLLVQIGIFTHEQARRVQVTGPADTRGHGTLGSSQGKQGVREQERFREYLQI